MKDWKKAIGFFLIAVVSVVAGIFVLAVDSIPDWLVFISSALTGFCSALGIYWVNPLQKILSPKELKEIGSSIPLSDTYSKSILFGRDSSSLEHNS